MSATTDVITTTPAGTPAGTPETAPPETAPPENFTEFRAWSRAKDRGEEPPKTETKLPEVPVETPAKDASAPAGKPETKTAAESGTEEEEEQETGEKKPEKPEESRRPMTPNEQRRWDKLTRQRYESEGRAKAAEERIKELEQRLAEKPAAETPGTKEAKPAEAATDREPALEDSEFQDKSDPYGEWMKSWNRWDRRQEAAKAAETSRKASEETRKAEAKTAHERRLAERDSEIEAFKAKPEHEDWDERLARVGDVELTPHLEWLIFQSGPELAYHLAGNRAELERVNKLGPLDAAIAIGEIRGRLNPPEKPASDTKSQAPASTARVTSAPKPITPVGGETAGGTPSLNDEKLARDFPAWRKVRRAQEDR